jgi:hypothetical protein
MFFADLCRELAAAAPTLSGPRTPALAADFERELNDNLAELFNWSR